MKFENIVTHLSIFDVEAKEIPCFTGVGAPTTATVGDVGCFYMDTLSGEVYKCTAVDIGETEEDSIFTWKIFRSGSEIVKTSGTGESYIADVASIPILKTGVSFIMIPHMTSTSKLPTINVNEFGAINIYRQSNSPSATTILSGGDSNSWLVQGKPYRLKYDGSFWIAVDFPKVNLSNHQTKTDERLNTVSKDIVGAINEVNGKTVDKLEMLDTWAGSTTDVNPTETGIAWVDGYYLGVNGQGQGVNGVVYQKIPIVAGDNIGFEKVATEGGAEVVKISAMGGGSSTDDSMVGTWVVIDEPEIPATEMPLSFTSNGETFIAIGSTYMGSSAWNIKAVTYMKANGEPSAVYTNNPSGDYGIQHGWSLLGTAYKTITVIEEPSAEVAAWIRANAVKQEDTEESDGVSFPLPFIRYANFKNLKDEEDNIVGYRFTVENLGGGTLQVGDKLQICCRRKFTGGKYKLRQMAERLITADDIGQRFLKIEVPKDERAEKWLFKNDHAGSYRTLSPMYFRLKRVTAYNESGFECNAIFSNVEQVWKTYNTDSHVVNIK